jgi:rhodanese-related sulfurtransferase
MNFWSIAIAIVAGVSIGLLMTRNKNFDFTKIRKLRSEEFKKNMRKGQLIDVRKKSEFAVDKIKGARNFTVSQASSKYTKLRRDQSVYLYCSNGRKSNRVARKMIKQGFKDIFILENGFAGYEK